MNLLSNKQHVKYSTIISPASRDTSSPLCEDSVDGRQADRTDSVIELDRVIELDQHDVIADTTRDAVSGCLDESAY